MTRVVELCAGIGGFSLAAEWMGWDVVGHVEIDPFCTRVLHKHWPDAVHISDLKDVHGDEFGAIDVLCGGLPCQPYSVAGKRAGDDDDRAIWPHALRVVRVARPRVCVFENVLGIITLALDGWLTDLEALGYACWTVVVPAAAVGAPHRRGRVWVVAEYVANARAGRGELVPADALRGRWGVGGVTERRGGEDEAIGIREDAPHPTPRGVRRGLPRWEPGQPARHREIVSDADRAGREEHGGAIDVRAQLATAECGSDAAAYSVRERRQQESRGAHGNEAAHEGRATQYDHQPASSGEIRIGQLSKAQPRLGESHDGPAGRMARYLDPRWEGDPMNAFGPHWEDGVPRVTDGCENRVAKLKALGNSLVPQVAYEIFRALDP